MKCIIEANGLKVFGKAIHALSRIGDEIWLDPLEKGLAVRSVNTAHSGYACFLFSPMFFQHYTPNLDQRQDNKTAKCKLSLKSVLPLFRSVATIDRSVCRCDISINIQEKRIIFQFNCRHGITKTHNLGYQECEALQAVFPAHLCPNILKAQPKLLCDIVMHFPVSQEEITLSISPIRVKLKNYYEEENGQNMSTEMSLHPDEFEYFQVGVDSDVTFCLKELRGLLAFAESHALPVSVHFGASGKPMSFSVEDMLLEAIVVLATLVDPVSPSEVSFAQEAPADTSIADPVHEDPKVAQATGLAPNHAGFHAWQQVASSQGSPVFSPAFHMKKVMQLQGHGVNPSTPKTSLCGRRCGSALITPVTPTAFKIHSLLFGAVSSGDGDALELPCLVCASDTEDDARDEGGRVEV
ncbi:cell cycle checkpoint control protein RAD9B [Electrophorus electricus]|uniref:cell cycle checkpoint control protein RAD9B n=1 Tax=Electrophorus electricus TaxID=8005 RepID=UPI0015CF935B|nr:cell cycle checkpoint control protein RAD9B [Electrophorus electricus]